MISYSAPGLVQTRISSTFSWPADVGGRSFATSGRTLPDKSAVLGHVRANFPAERNQAAPIAVWDIGHSCRKGSKRARLKALNEKSGRTEGRHDLPHSICGAVRSACRQHHCGGHRHHQGVSGGEEGSTAFPLRPRLGQAFTHAIIIGKTSCRARRISRVDRCGHIVVGRLGRFRQHPNLGVEGGLVHRRLGRRRLTLLPIAALSPFNGGLSAGLVFGASETRLYGRVSSIRYPSDVAGVYSGAGASAALLFGARAIVLAQREGRSFDAVRPAGRIDRQRRP